MMQQASDQEVQSDVSTPDWFEYVHRWKLSRVLGIGALVAGGVTLFVWLVIIALLLGPLLFWVAWNWLEFGPAIGLPELGFWAIVLATLFLVVGWFGKVTLAGIIFIVDPSWLQSEAVVHWPEPSMRNFLAIVLLAGLAATPHARQKPKE